MTPRQKKIDTITDQMYYHMVEIISLANELEALHLNRDGETLRSIADQLERTAIRLIDKLPKHD